MTSQEFPSNKVVVIGVLDAEYQKASAVKRGDAPKASVRRVRTAGRGSAYAVDVQLPSPYNEAMGLRLAIGSGVSGATALDSAQPGDVFLFEGHLVQIEEVDRRFAEYGEQVSEGLHYRDVTVKVSSVRPRDEGDPSGTGSSVWLEGEVVEPPALFRHPDHPETQLARMRLRTHAQFVSGDTSFFPTLEKACEVMCVVPVTSNGAGYLYRQGNRVQVRGMLERITLRQRSADVRDRLAELEETWKTTYAALQDKPEKLRRAGNAYARERARLALGTRTMVLVATVTPLDGAEPMSVEEAQAARDAFTKELRERRRRRREEIAAARKARAAARTQEVGVQDDNDAQPEAQAGGVTVQRPRRRVPATVEASPAEAEMVIEAVEA
jgi:hypothetical protein